MTVEQLERFEKYYLSDEEISPDDFEFVLANIQNKYLHGIAENQSTRTKYDIRDYFKVYSICEEIDNTERSYLFSAQNRCIKYTLKEYSHNKAEIIDFSKSRFNPRGDLISHTISIGNYSFSARSAVTYNFLILLLKWSDKKFESGEHPIHHELTATPIVITKENHEEFGVFESGKDITEIERIEEDGRSSVITISSTVSSYSTPMKTTVTVSNENNTESSFANAREELENLVGLDSIKKDVVNLINLVKVQQMRKNKGLKSVPVSLHLVFTGNPGTGKTTVARILAQLYKEIGVLKKGQLIEVDRSDLVAGYVGQTALKTQEKIKEAMGGILFIDEAYTLAKDGNDFGQEAIDTILKSMEDNRDEFIVIVAGYDDPMQKFINSNPGLKSRFNKYFHFPDYSSNELIDIFKMMIRQYDYTITDDAMEAVTKKIEEMESKKGNNFANARDVIVNDNNNFT